MRAEGLEPPWAFAHGDLNAACLPISPRPPGSMESSGPLAWPASSAPAESCAEVPQEAFLAVLKMGTETE